MEPGKWIRALREERHIKPSDVERITRSIAEAKQNTDFYVSHSTLADIEASSIPSIHKLSSLAICFRLPLYQLLLPFGIDPEEATGYESASGQQGLQLQRPEAIAKPFRFQLTFDANVISEETTLLLQSQDPAMLPSVLRARLNPLRYRYAVIGSKDDSMDHLLPPGSFVEVDTAQKTVQVAAWRTLRDRPIYLVWHTSGHTCCWCQVDGRELLLVTHPLSHRPIRRFKMPSEATVVGRVTSAWLPFESSLFERESAS